jgi:hypothetical protein
MVMFDWLLVFFRNTDDRNTGKQIFAHLVLQFFAYPIQFMQNCVDYIFVHNAFLSHPMEEGLL